MPSKLTLLVIVADLPANIFLSLLLPGAYDVSIETASIRLTIFSVNVFDGFVRGGDGYVSFELL